MKALAAGAIVILASLSCWLMLSPLPGAARAFATFLLVPLAAMSIAQARAIARTQPTSFPRVSMYLSSAVTLWILAVLAIVAAERSHFTPGMLGLRPLANDVFVVWTAFGLASAALLVAVGKLLNLQDSPMVLQLLPQSAGEKALFVFLSITAGVTEEIVFRGFLITALGFVIGNVWVSAGIAAAAFGVLHAYQLTSGAARAAILGFALSVPFLISGSVIPSMLAHTLIDIIGGLWLVKRLN